MAGFKFELGQELACQVTGFSGIAVTRSETITGRRSYCVQPQKTRRGTMAEPSWIDEEMLLVKDDGKKLKLR